MDNRTIAAEVEGEKPEHEALRRVRTAKEPCWCIDVDRILTCKLNQGHHGPHIDPESGTFWEDH